MLHMTETSPTPNPVDGQHMLIWPLFILGWFLCS